MTFRSLPSILIGLTLFATPTFSQTNPSLEIDLNYSGRSVDRTVREEVELQLSSDMTTRGCFGELRFTPPKGSVNDEPTDDSTNFLLRIVIQEVFEETTYDTSIAQRADPSRPAEYDLLHTSRIRIEAFAELRTGDGERLLRRSNVRGSGSHRPLLFGEDSRSVALQLASEGFAREARIFACKGGQKRRQKELKRTAQAR
jgi:hypothetical protein